jgi:acyl-CoA synthetase (NDP forming)
VANPFDYHTFMWGDREAMAATFAATMSGPHDATLLILDAPPLPDQDPSTWLVAAEAFADAAATTGRRGFVVATLPECLNDVARAAITARGLAPLQGIADALCALDRAAWLAEHSPAPPPLLVAAPGDTQLIDESSAKQRLATMQVRVPRGVTCARNDVPDTAARVGYPVTLKALHLAHKTEMGGVAVGIADPDSLSTQLALMPESCHEFLVEQTISDVVAEVLVGIRRAAPIGWLITIGAGGVFTEVWRDTTCLLAPATREDVRTALQSLRIAPLLSGYRGKPAANVDALVDVVMALQDAAQYSDVVEIELNPILVTPDSAIAVDALLIVETKGKS